MGRRFALGMAVLLLGAIAACGGDEAATEIDVELKEFGFAPDTWTVAAGEEISVDLSNAGTLEHEWVILQDGVTISSEDDLPETEEELLADFVYWEDEVEPGESKTLTFTAPSAGEYQIICAIEGHFTSGMEGTLTVQAP